MSFVCEFCGSINTKKEGSSCSVCNQVDNSNNLNSYQNKSVKVLSEKELNSIRTITDLNIKDCLFNIFKTKDINNLANYAYFDITVFVHYLPSAA